MLAVSATCTAINRKRQSNSNQVVIRTDLKAVDMGQSPAFKNQLLALTPKKGIQGAFELSFVNLAEADKASKIVIESTGLNMTAPDGSTQFFNVATASDAAGKQPINIGLKQSSQGSLYVASGELKLNSISPQFDTWVMCPGNNHPELSWVGVVDNTVTIPTSPAGQSEECRSVRLFTEDPANPTQHANTC
ncbi:MAG: hypothetical protein Q9219_003490 [cf. Caloplaca sp. 3 TL-2023]